MLNYFVSLFNRDEPSLTKHLLNWYSAPLTWLSPLTALSSLETWNLIPNTEI
ncbi:hypothetical protein CONCODRAFT_14237 [Conidiobolus coronatus NRRL 28638]|uniref:Uncharacterized protein n=1 Tax=Conidiobolus coronatus (strain ATCC 28846 / CBS 209.66 / NRRL 28638) TaxID=796925 RepID=A0A137NPD3_CONC2|nr:hypothetical protein CONCODRAFT_14237 [Conidiobolus coronatus NRRL 28638]|eukprot:KXN64599.1 hypothetical protein CONCODRAFT_14237 [Conidiobolus coronatus NRRL 28638]